MKLKIAYIFNATGISGSFHQALSTYLLIEKYNQYYQFIPIALNKTIYKKLKPQINSLVLERTNNRFFKKHHFDLAFYSTPSEINHDLNYIVTVWDLCHLNYPEFPETRFFREHFEIEKMYHSYSNAVAVLTDSKIGRKNLVDRYRLQPERVYTAPFVPPKQIEQGLENFDVKKHYGIKTDYVFYPAQFWSHKNHAYLLKGISLLEKKHQKKISAVFTGKDYGNLKTVLSLAKKLQLTSRVFYLGMVPENHIKPLYQQSLALVMPSYFGPTNLPPLEAASLGVPIFYSDLHYFRQQTKKGAVYIDLNDPNDLSQKLNALITGVINRKKLTKEAEKIINEWKEIDYWNVIDTILKKFTPLQQTWGDHFYQASLLKRSYNYLKKNGIKSTFEKIFKRIF